jgi:dolichol kinase
MSNLVGQESFHLRSELHILRKLWHVFTGVLGLTLHLYFNPGKDVTASILLGLAILGFATDLIRPHYQKFNQFVFKVMGPLMRESERKGISGFPFYALGTSLSMFFFEEKVAILGILFLVFSDPVSSVIGITYGRDKIIKNKSIQGSLAGFCVCYFISFSYCFHYMGSDSKIIMFSLFAAIFGTLSELLSFITDDNLTIPLVSGLGITLVNLLIPLF